MMTIQECRTTKLYKKVKKNLTISDAMVVVQDGWSTDEEHCICLAARDLIRESAGFRMRELLAAYKAKTKTSKTKASE